MICLVNFADLSPKSSADRISYALSSVSSDTSARYGIVRNGASLSTCTKLGPTNPMPRRSGLFLLKVASDSPMTPMSQPNCWPLSWIKNARVLIHPPQGSKGSADALAGVVYQLSRIPAWQLVGRVPNAANAAAAVAQAPLGGTVTPIRIAETGAMSMIRALRGMPAR